MTRWEYKLIPLSVDGINVSEWQLNMDGLEGWEAVGIVTTPAHNPASSPNVSHTALCKRPLQGLA